MKQHVALLILALTSALAVSCGSQRLNEEVVKVLTTYLTEDQISE